MCKKIILHKSNNLFLQLRNKPWYPIWFKMYFFFKKKYMYTYMCTQITLLIITFTFKTLTFNFEFWWCGHVIIYYVNNIWFCAKHLNRKIVIIYVTMCSLEFLIWMLCSDQCQAWWSWIPMDIFEVWKSQELLA